MRRILTSSVTAAILLVLVAIANTGGCKSGETCDFTFNQFLNGSSADTQDSEWECQNGGVIVFTIAFFGDSTGFRSDTGEFTWEQIRCRAIDFETVALETGTFDNIMGTITTIGDRTLGNLSLEQESDELGDITVTCTYNQF
ncbi:MAG: hypothetical protein RIG61_11815 [Deltaproteobacteria bacterium]